MIEMRGVWFDLKIHIVQKGDTLWEIAKTYGVDFEQLQELNSQISSPDMIMPGMKIKVPSPTKPVKKETVSVKETKKEKPLVEESKKKEIPKPLPMIKEDDHQKPTKIKPEMPMKQTPQVPPKQHKPIETKITPQPIKEMIELPMMQEETIPHLPEFSQQEQIGSQQQPLTEPPGNQYFQPCCPPVHHHYYSIMGQMSPGQHMQQGHPMQQPMSQHAINPCHCGCESFMPFRQHAMQGQMPQPFPLPNEGPMGYQSSYEQRNEPIFHGAPMYSPLPNNDVNHPIGNPFPMPPGFPHHSNVALSEKENERNLSDENLQTGAQGNNPIND